MLHIFRYVCLLLCVLSVGISCGGGTDTASSSPVQQHYQSLEIAPVGATIRTGTSGGISGFGNRFVALGRHSDGSSDYSWIPGTAVAAVNWSSSTPSVATIDAQGRFNPLSSGTTTITASLGNLTTSTILQVSDSAPVLTAVEIEPGLPNVGNDGKIVGVQFQAIAKFDDGSEQDITKHGIWISSDITAATVDSTGLVTYKSNAICNIMFLYGLSYNSVSLVHTQ